VFKTTYSSKILPLSPTEANCVSEVWRRQVVSRQHGSRFLRPTRRVWLRPAWNQRVGDGTERQLATGVAWCRANPVRFQVEVTEWSGNKTVLALRSRKFRRIATTTTYGQLVREALQAIAAELLDIHAKESPTHLRLLPDGAAYRCPWRSTDARPDVPSLRARCSSDATVGAMSG
jgi:hypothetical protein